MTKTAPEVKSIVTVLTYKSHEKIFNIEGGSGYWKADPTRIDQCKYLVVTRHARSPYGAEDDRPQGQAFLIGRGLKAVYDTKHDRQCITFQEFCEVEIADFWPGGRNPVAYLSLEEFNERTQNTIDLDALEFKPFDGKSLEQGEELPRVKALTIAEAKMGLAKTFGIAESQIDIVIRG
jgi:hypothetical protein